MNILDLLKNGFNLEYDPEVDIVLPTETLEPVILEISAVDVQDTISSLKETTLEVLSTLEKSIAGTQGVQEYLSGLTGNPTLDQVDDLRKFEIFHLEEGNLDIFLYEDALRLQEDLTLLENSPLIKSLVEKGVTLENVTPEDPDKTLLEYYTLKTDLLADTMTTLAWASGSAVEDSDVGVKDLFTGILGPSDPLVQIFNQNVGYSSTTYTDPLLKTLGFDTKDLSKSLNETKKILAQLKTVLKVLRGLTAISISGMLEAVRSYAQSQILKQISNAKAQIYSRFYAMVMSPIIQGAEDLRAKTTTSVPVIKHIQEMAMESIFEQLIKFQLELANLAAEDQELYSVTKTKSLTILKGKRIDQLLQFIDVAEKEVDHYLGSSDILTTIFSDVDKKLWPLPVKKQNVLPLPVPGKTYEF